MPTGCFRSDWPNRSRLRRRASVCLAPLCHDARHLGKLLRQKPRLVPCEKSRCSVAPPIEVTEGSTACVLYNEFAGGFDYGPWCRKSRRHTCRFHFCLSAPRRFNRQMGALNPFSKCIVIIHTCRLCIQAGPAFRARSRTPGGGRWPVSKDGAAAPANARARLARRGRGLRNQKTRPARNGPGKVVTKS